MCVSEEDGHLNLSRYKRLGTRLIVCSLCDMVMSTCSDVCLFFVVNHVSGEEH